MKKEINQLQTIFGLSGYEAMLYLAALNFDQVNLSDLARKAGIPRTASYEPLKSILNQGFLVGVKIKKRTYYSAVKPEKLKYILERKKLELDNMITSLERKIDIPERKLAISYFSGRAGVEMAADIVLEEGRTKKALSWEATGLNIQEKGIRYLQNYIDRRVEKGIIGNMIVASDADNKVLKKLIARDKQELRKTIIVNSKKYPVKAAIMVFDDMVDIFTFGENPFAVVIKNKDIARTMQSIHEMFWDRYGD